MKTHLKEEEEEEETKGVYGATSYYLGYGREKIGLFSL